MKHPPSSGYVLKFISGKYQGGEFPLELDKDVVIGRSSDLDMVLVEDMVSRKHSRISSENGDLYIEDLGSTNGTFVNGEKVTKKKLKEGDRILVGTSIIKLVAASEASAEPQAPSEEGNDEPSVDVSPPSPKKTPSETMDTRQSVTLTGSISGLLDEVPLSDLLQLFSSSKKSGVLVLHSNERLGKIYLRDGRVYFASIDERTEVSPYKSFYRMLAWETGTFSLEPATNESFDEEIDSSTEALMMEGMRQLDEVRNLGDDVPDYQDILSLEQPLIPPLRALTPELLDTLQLIHNYGKVELVLNQSLATDLETLQDIIYLIRNEYISVTPTSDG